MLLEVNHLSIAYGKGNPVVHDVSFSVDRGKILAIIGESGSGKTTVLRAVGHILPKQGQVTDGSILLDGKDIDPANIRDKASVIFQDSGAMLNPIRTIGTEFSEYLATHGIEGEEAETRMLNLLSQVRLHDPAGILKSYPFELSGGMRQRVMIAMALACSPQILIADEPTTALDVTIQAQILDLLREIQKKLGTATVFVTHDLGVVARIADRVAVMYAGKIVEIGTVDEIFYDPRHPYTWGLLRSIPAFSRGKESLPSIPGMPPSLLHPPKGDAFASRNAYALEIDFEEEPPMFRVTDSHYAATWLLDERAPKVVTPIGGNTDGT